MCKLKLEFNVLRSKIMKKGEEQKQQKEVLEGEKSTNEKL